jgi:hypothetical protein
MLSSTPNATAQILVTGRDRIAKRVGRIVRPRHDHAIEYRPFQLRRHKFAKPPRGERLQGFYFLKLDVKNRRVGPQRQHAPAQSISSRPTHARPPRDINPNALNGE